jgi:hypothetical protein
MKTKIWYFYDLLPATKKDMLKIDLGKFNSKHLTALLYASCILYACSKEESVHNTLTEEEKEEGWQLLFDGKTTRGWHLYNLGNVPSSWVALKGELYCDPYNFEVKIGDLITDKTYKDFDLRFEWKISGEGDSGVFINVQEDDKYRRILDTGQEYQLLDDARIAKSRFLQRDSTRWVGCLYGIKPQQEIAEIRPAGSWNESRIKQKDGRITFWLNGKITVDQDCTGEEWRDLVADSELKRFPDYGTFRDGHIALQYWAKGVSFRNMKILEL